MQPFFPFFIVWALVAIDFVNAPLANVFYMTSTGASRWAGCHRRALAAIDFVNAPLTNVFYMTGTGADCLRQYPL